MQLIIKEFFKEFELAPNIIFIPDKILLIKILGSFNRVYKLTIKNNIFNAYIAFYENNKYNIFNTFNSYYLLSLILNEIKYKNITPLFFLIDFIYTPVMYKKIIVPQTIYYNNTKRNIKNNLICDEIEDINIFNEYFITEKNSKTLTIENIIDDKDKEVKATDSIIGYDYYNYYFLKFLTKNKFRGKAYNISYTFFYKEENDNLLHISKLISYLLDNLNKKILSFH